ncbi:MULTISPECIES: amino acid ABC transporter substrate-binding protein [Undibacterium]|jgi:ABC-type amino acid transport substrate-binding protein|uniref:Amino acid ABC transporter substrate-binding protein n=1 Tax=Undibacterium umbellatum TaxID=2762300 RepID=A0ABR6Z7S7_9BURK|nr:MULTISPECIES: amino acid ABC transporter substrate-binding protein [Undibacterium]MBC3907629.1 amino acid ABC transporter substrate-binding protein [Undibacterium umbellatum]MDP1978861.1 amino acid ABC transporter substrate-binding protein [Undibacterium sp.]
MKLRCILQAGVFASAAVLAQVSVADTFDRIKKSQTINIAYREAALPFSYLSESKAPIGYTIDICTKMVDALKKELKLPQLKINFIPVTADNRIQAMTSGKTDMECGSTSNTAERRKEVDFTIPHFFSTLRMMVSTSSGIKNWPDLKDKKVVFTKGTSADKFVLERDKVRALHMKMVEGKDHSDSFNLLETNQVDAFAQDEAILFGLKAKAKDPAKLTIVGDPLASEAYAIMLPKGDAAFKKAIDAEMGRMMADGEITRLYEKWFTKPIQPKNMNLAWPMGSLLKETIRFPSDKVN